jgi:hypothetical protein
MKKIIGGSTMNGGGKHLERMYWAVTLESGQGVVIFKDGAANFP